MTSPFQAIIIGEVLFDLFEDGQAVLGGAPFNVAWHLQGFGQAPLFISRVGQDEYGQQVRSTARQWGMDTSGLQEDALHPTGMVKVSLENGQPSFDICAEVAYDFIDVREVDRLLGTVPRPFLYHGSLAARSGQVYDGLLQCRQAAALSFVDINLRPPWWDRTTTSRLLQKANWLKVNDNELVILSGAGASETELVAAATDMLQQYDIDNIIVTRGEQGAFLVNHDMAHHARPIKVDNIQDTVGAGDAFSSVCMLGILHGWSAEVMLERAAEFAAEICRQRGATSMNLNLYETYKEKWQLN